MPPRPGGVAMATMVSSGCKELILTTEDAEGTEEAHGLEDGTPNKNGRGEKIRARACHRKELAAGSPATHEADHNKSGAHHHQCPRLGHVSERREYPGEGGGGRRCPYQKKHRKA